MPQADAAAAHLNNDITSNGTNVKRAWTGPRFFKRFLPVSDRSASCRQYQVRPPQWYSSRRSFLTSFLPSIRGKQDPGYDPTCPRHQRRRFIQRSGSMAAPSSSSNTAHQPVVAFDEKELVHAHATKKSHADPPQQQPSTALVSPQQTPSSPRYHQRTTFRERRPPCRRPMSEDLSVYLMSSQRAANTAPDDDKPALLVWMQRKSDILPLNSIGTESTITTIPTVSKAMMVSSCFCEPPSDDSTTTAAESERNQHASRPTAPNLLRRLSSLGASHPPRRTTSLAITAPNTAPPTRSSNTSHSAPSLLLSRSLSLSTYYKRRLSALVTGGSSNSSNSSSSSSSSSEYYGLASAKQDEAVAFWKSTVAQIEAPATALYTEQDDLQLLLQPPPCQQQPRRHPPPPTAPISAKNSNKAVCRFILRELYATETSYYHLLKFIYSKYMQPMSTALQEQNNLLLARQSSADVATLFAYLPQLLQLSEHLIPMLEHAMAIQDSTGVARAFVSHHDHLATFLRYAVHYQSNFRFIRKTCQTNPMLLHIERECLSRHDTRRMGIADYLIAPIQRVPRYCLLLQDLLKHTPPYDPSYLDVRMSVALVTSLADAMNLYSI